MFQYMAYADRLYRTLSMLSIRYSKRMTWRVSCILAACGSRFDMKFSGDKTEGHEPDSAPN